jgi:hypothetical protein
MKEEITSILKKEAMHPVLLANLSHKQRKKVMRSCMFLKEKFDSHGNFTKLKSRLVANGKQQERAEIENPNSPTASLAALFISLVIAAHEGRKASIHDVGTAFLNAEMSGETVHVILDKIMTGLLLKIKPEYKEFVTSSEEIVMELDKALYGCIQSARLWYDKLRSVLEKNGFKANDIDQCVFNKTVNGEQITLIVYVDDIEAAG